MAEETDRIHQEARRTDRTTETDYDLIDNEAGLTEQERKLLHVLANSGKKTTYRHRRANENRRSKNESREKNNDGNAITGSFSRLGY